MRFDDSLQTVMAMPAGGAAGLRATWLQAVDLIGRGRPGPVEAAIARLRAMRDAVPLAVRVASARGLERADPPAALVALFADDAPAVAAPVVRSARLRDAEWIALLPAMQPATRGVLRHRRDLDPAVRGALAAFGAEDLVLADDAAAPEPMAAPEPVAAPMSEPAAILAPAPPPAFVAPDPLPFVSVADAARELPVVAEALRREQLPDPAAPGSDFAIAEIVARIEARQRSAPPPVAAAAAPSPDRFRFETDAAGTIRWCDVPERGALIGLSLARGAHAPVVDAGVSGALARRAPFADARLEVPGTSAVGGGWRIGARPRFDHASGRFTGYLGTARRPRRDEEPRLAAPTGDLLRQLVHELRTPANAISGFGEMIGHQLLGPVPAGYRGYADAIVGEAAALLGAIDDLDTAARLEAGALVLRPGTVALAPLLARLTAELRPLAELRHVGLDVFAAPDAVAAADPQAAKRLFARLLAALLASAAEGEAVVGTIVLDGAMLRGEWARPAALAGGEGPLFAADAELEAAAPGAPLLGAGFAFRLARRLAAELGGGLVVEAERLTLRLPAAVDRGMGQATV